MDSTSGGRCLWHIELNQSRKINPKDDMQGSYLGPEYSNSEIESSLKNLGAKYEVLEEEKIIDNTSNDLSEGKVVGWFQGRMEFGPRALGLIFLL